MRALLLSALLVAACNLDGGRAARHERPNRPVGTDDVGTDGRENRGVTDADRTGEANVESYDARFIDAMVAYSKFSEDLADVGARRAQHDELKVFAQNLAKADDTRVEQLKNWRDLWFKDNRPGLRIGERSKDFDDAARNLPGAPPYQFGVAWKDVSVSRGRDGKTVAVTQGVTEWDSQQVLTALRDVPKESFDNFFVATMIEHSRWGVEAAKGAVGKIQHPELGNIAQEIVGENTANLSQLRSWQQQWAGTTYGGPATR